MNVPLRKDKPAVAQKELVLGVDYNDDVSAAFKRGEVGDTPLIEQIMNNAVKAGMTTVCWRVSACGLMTYHTQVGTMMTGLRAPFEHKSGYGLIMKRIDPLRVAVDAAHERGLRILVYFTLFDEAKADPRTRTFTNISDFGLRHPEYWVRHWSNGSHIPGVFSLGHTEVRDYYAGMIRETLAYEPDGIYLDCARTHAGRIGPTVYGPVVEWTNPYIYYGYNDPDLERHKERYGIRGPRRLCKRDLAWNDLPEEERNWQCVRGEALTVLLREIRPEIRGAGKELWVCFNSPPSNRHNPGYWCRAPLGRYHVDWLAWAAEGLIDAIRLNMDHGRFGYDDWRLYSEKTFTPARKQGVRMIVDCAIDTDYTELEDSPHPLPISRQKHPEAYFETMGAVTRRMLKSSADGVFFYEHCGNDDRTWEAIRRAGEFTAMA